MANETCPIVGRFLTDLKFAYTNNSAGPLTSDNATALTNNLQVRGYPIVSDGLPVIELSVGYTA
jgi:hypothetical protein